MLSKRARFIWWGGWVFGSLIVLLGIGLIGRWGWTWYQRQQGLETLTSRAQVLPMPTLPTRFDQFQIDNTPLPTLATNSAAAPRTTAATRLLPTPTPTYSLKPLDTPMTLNPLKADAVVSVPYVRGFDFLINQDGQEVLVLRGKQAEGTKPKVMYAYPLVSPNGKLVAFFEWLQPKIKNQLATADVSVLKILDLTTGKIRTTRYEFSDLAHDLDGGLPVRWNERNYLEIEYHASPLNVSHILYDPDRAVVMAEHNVSMVPVTPWQNSKASEVLRGFSISPDGQWRVSLDSKKFLLLPVGNTKQLGIDLVEVQEGMMVKLFGWQGNEIWFEVEKKPYTMCVNKALIIQNADQRAAELTKCFQDNHYLVAVDSSTQQVKRRWYNYQIGVFEHWRWVRLPVFLQQGTLNNRNEIVYFEPHVPLVYPTDGQLRLTSGFTNQLALITSNQVIELVGHTGQKMALTLESPVDMAMVHRSSYMPIWTNQDAFVILYPSGYDEPITQRILLVDTKLKIVRLLVQNSSLFTKP